MEMDSYENLNKPGVWFVRSTRPSIELCRYVYDIAVELGKPIVVYSSIPKREIQNKIIEIIKRNRIEATTSELERNWLEDELSEYNSHGFFWYPKDMNDLCRMVLFGQTMFSSMNSRYCLLQTISLT